MFSTIRLRVLIATLVAAVCGYGASIPADETPESIKQVTSQTRLLVSTTGRVVHGKITPHAGGYMVEMTGGSLFMPFNQVRLTASNLADAYQKLRKSMPEPTATNHVSLARWCISNKQFSAAKSELLDALEIETNRPDARQMLARLDSLANPQPAAVPQQKTPRTDGFHPGEFESLNGLSRSSGQEFVKKVLPILRNKCGNASCHGGRASETPFRLIRTGGRDHRVYAERDLAEVLKYITSTSPGGSPLFSGLAAGHGGTKRSIFHGRPGIKQTDSIRAWVYQVAGERKSRSTTTLLSTQSRSTAGQPQLSANSPIVSGAVQTAHTVTAQPTTLFGEHLQSQTLNGQGASTPARQAILDAVREENTPDAFDPDIFNSMNGIER